MIHVTPERITQYVRRWAEQLGCTAPEALEWRLGQIATDVDHLVQDGRQEAEARVAELEAWATLSPAAQMALCDAYRKAAEAEAERAERAEARVAELEARLARVRAYAGGLTGGDPESPYAPIANAVQNIIHGRDPDDDGCAASPSDEETDR